MMAFDCDTNVRCTRCQAHKPDQVGLSLPATDDAGVRDLGFCCVECLLAWIDATYPTRAAAAPSSVAGPPPAAGGGTGTTREPVGSGKS